MRRTNRQRTEFQCGLCGSNLGTRPWKGEAPNLYTLCGCYLPARKKEKKMRRPTVQEKVTAILAARQGVAEYLQTIGKIEAFNGFSKDEIAGLIRVCQEGVQKSLHDQIGDGFEDPEIPF